MRILVTGSCGFLGSHLLDFLETKGHEVIGIDNLSSNVRPPESHDRTGDLHMRLPRLGDLKFDQAYHLASPVGPVGVLGHGGTIAAQIVRDAALMASWCVRWQCPLLSVSSSEVYGADGAVYEDHSAIVALNDPSPRLEYAVGKLAAEVLIRNTPDLDYRIVRPFNIAGPRQSARGGFVLPRFIGQALAGEPLTVYGNGSALRAFTHVADIVEGLWLIMAVGSPRAYNLGNSENLTTIYDLALRVVRATHSQSAIAFTDPQALWGPEFREAGDKWPANCDAATELGWSPTRSLDDIIHDYLKETR